MHDVARAPSIGRSCHLIASASKDKTVRVWQLPSDDESQGGGGGGGGRGGEGGSSLSAVEELTHDDQEVWRVEWNVTGTILASSCDDGTVRLWKQDFYGGWQCLSTVCGDASDGPEAKG